MSLILSWTINYVGVVGSIFGICGVDTKTVSNISIIADKEKAASMNIQIGFPTILLQKPQLTWIRRDILDLPFISLCSVSFPYYACRRAKSLC